MVRKSSIDAVPLFALPPKSVFKRTWVNHNPTGYTVVQWELGPHFLDPKPHEFQLQIAATSSPAESEWTNVGPAADTGYLIDDERREYGKTFDHHYRVQLTTPQSTYVSHIVPVGIPTESRRDWRLAREMLRQATKRAKKFTGTPGYLLKRRRYGPACPTCINPHTGEPTRSDCPDCFGTRLNGGYHASGLILMHASQGLVEHREDVETGLQEGTTKPYVSRTEMQGFPYINALDIWVEQKSGKRWAIHKVLETAALRGYAFAVDVEMRWLPLSHKIYEVPLETGS